MLLALLSGLNFRDTICLGHLGEGGKYIISESESESSIDPFCETFLII